MFVEKKIKALSIDGVKDGCNVLNSLAEGMEFSVSEEEEEVNKFIQIKSTIFEESDLQKVQVDEDSGVDLIKEKVFVIKTARDKAKAINSFSVLKKLVYESYKKYLNFENRTSARLTKFADSLRDEIIRHLDSASREGKFLKEDIKGLKVEYFIAVKSVDEAEIPKKYFKIDMDAIESDAKKGIPISGVETYSKPKITVF